MSQATRNTIPGRTVSLLHAYHDGELSGFARWRFERRLRRSPELQRELEALSRVGDWVRESEAAESPDLWDAIALRLPAVDARRGDPADSQPGIGWLAWPGAFASALVAAVLAFQHLTPATPSGIGVVRWIDSGPRDVMVLRAGPDTTIVWVLGAPGKRPPRGEHDNV